jgi:hypothetical protein
MKSREVSSSIRDEVIDFIVSYCNTTNRIMARGVD